MYLYYIYHSAYKEFLRRERKNLSSIKYRFDIRLYALEVRYIFLNKLFYLIYCLYNSKEKNIDCVEYLYYK